MVTHTEAQCPSFSRRRFSQRTNQWPTSRCPGSGSRRCWGCSPPPSCSASCPPPPASALVGWITGLVVGSAAAALLVTARRRSDQPAIFPADWVTLTRMLLIAGVTGLVADSFSRPVSITALVTLSAVALALDAVDGQVARRTGTATPVGTRIDGEADAFLILVLSIAVSRDYGSWVLAIGAARYVFLLAGWLIPWLRAPLPPRFWRKVVAAVQGVVLTVAVSGVTSRLVGMIAVAVALLLLAESFGRDVIWLYRAGASARVRRARAVRRSPRWRSWSCGSTSWRPTVPGSSASPLLSASRWNCWSWWRWRWCCRPGHDGSWPRSPGSSSACSRSTRSSTWRCGTTVDRSFNPLTDWSNILPAVAVVRDAIGSHAHQRRVRRDLGRYRRDRRRPHRGDDSRHRGGRPSPPRRRSRPCRSHRRLGALRGAGAAGHPGVSGRLGQRHRAGRPAGAAPTSQRSPTRVSSGRKPAPLTPSPPSPPRTC